MADVALWVFWGAVVFLLYASGGFTLLVGLVGLVRRRGVRKAPLTPRVSVIIAAYNEEDTLAARLENALAAEYPSDRLEIIVASDGSSDATEAIAALFADRGVRLLPLPRRGKIPTLNDAVAHASGDILVFSDANTMWSRRALAALVSNFADPMVGGVAGHTAYLVKTGGESSALGEQLYWSYDTWLKELESQTGSVVSAHGGLYAIRRQLFRPIVDAGITDDFAISTAVVEQGYRLVFESHAVAHEYAVPEARREFRRRVRLMTRGLRAVAYRRRLLNPFRYGFYSFVLASHKIGRRLVFAALALLAASSVVLWPAGPWYRAAAIAQLLFYGLALAGALLRRSGAGRAAWLYLPFYVVMANLACALAWVRALRGERIELWQPQRHGAGS